MPSPYTEYVTVADKKQAEVWVHGGGDAAVFRRLEHLGLLRRPRTTLPNKYVYEITEDGRLVVEHLAATQSLPHVSEEPHT